MSRPSLRLLAPLFAALLLCPSPSAQAAGQDDTLTRCWTRSASAPEAQLPLEVWFQPDEKQCKQRYGANWRAVCNRRTAMDGRPGRGIALSPAHPGAWRWSGDRSLAFQPAAAWPAGTAYSFSLSAAALPPDTRLNDTTVRFTTQPVKIRLNAAFHMDPQQRATMALTGRMTFNYTMDRASVLERLRVAARDASGQARLGEPVYTWEDGNGADTLLLSVPVLRLPEKAAAVHIALEDGALAASGGAPARGLALLANLPGRDTLFEARGVNALVLTGADLRARQLLALEFSLPALPRVVAAQAQIHLLPRQRVENGDKGRPPYNWWNKNEIDAAVLARSTMLKTALPETADVPAQLVQLGLAAPVEAGRFLHVRLPGGLPGPDGLRLKADASYIARVPDAPEELRIMQNGAVLALSGDKTLSIYSRNLDSVRYELARVRPEHLNAFLAPLAGGNGSFARPELNDDALYAVSTVLRGSLPLSRADAAAPQFCALNLGQALKGRPGGLFVARLSGVRGKEVVAADSRFVMLTDIGLIRKTFVRGDGALFAASLSSGLPLKDVQIEVLGANGLPVFTDRTDADGRCLLPNLRGLNREKQPIALLAKRGEDFAVLPFADSGRAVDTSRFATGGNTSSADGISAFVFGERDIYRPGETVRFGCLLRQGSWESLEDLPLRAVLYDARGNEFAVTPLRLPASGLGEFSWKLPLTAPTGTYRLDLRLDTQAGGVLHSSSFTVNEFQPDTLRLAVTLPDAPAQGWLCTKDAAPLAAGVTLHNLFGAPAADHDVRASLSLQPAVFRFAGYPDWTFYDAAPLARPSTQSLAGARTDKAGALLLALPAVPAASARLNVRVEGFAAGGGRGVKAAARMLVSPLRALLGWKTGSNLSYLRQNGKVELNLLAVNPALAPLALGKITLDTLHVSYTASLFRDENGQYRYDRLRQEKRIAGSEAQLPATGLTLPLPLDKPGDYVLEVHDAGKALLARIPYTVAGTAAANFNEARDPALTARLDKADYAPGDTVEVALSTPYKGAGLITVERDTVVAHAWFKGQAGDSVQRVRLPRDFEGRAYLHVTYFRALDDADIFTKPLAAAVLPFTVNMGGRDLGLRLRVDGQDALPVVRPGTDMRVQVSAKRAARAIVFAVDEGILQMTAYATPDPLRALLGDRALEVVTTQYFDLLLPEYGLMKAALSAFGGGEEAGAALAASGQNPFRRAGEASAVFWSGLMEVGPQAKTLAIPVPATFSGRWRIMAVAASGDGVSSARADALAQAEVVIQPALPLFVAPNDSFTASVSLTDMSGLKPGQSRTVRLEAETDAGLRVLDGLPQTLRLRPAEAQTVTLRLRAADLPGAHHLTLRAVPEQGNTVTRAVSLSVRPATPRATRLRSGELPPGQALSVPLGRALYPQYAALTASVSALPLPAAHALMATLAAYPYGCTEQVLSAAFPALLLLQNPELAPAGRDFAPDALRERVLAALETLAARHRGDGQFAVWPAGHTGDLFLSVYAADFLTCAAEAGLALPGNLHSAVLEGLRNRAGETPASLDEARVSAYATWVLTRNGILTTNLLGTLQAAKRNGLIHWDRDLTAVFMAGCWKLMMRADLADSLLRGYAPEAAAQDPRFDPMTGRALYLSVLAGQFADRLRAPQTRQALRELLKLAQSAEPGTLAAAQTARALIAWSRGAASAAAKASISARDRAGKALPLPPLSGGAVQTLTLGAADGDTLSRLHSLTFSSDAPLYWQFVSTGFDRALPVAPVSEGLELRRELRRTDGSPVQSIRLGDEIVVAIHARAYGGRLDNVAISDVLPGGLELMVAEGGEVLDTGTELGRLPTDVDMSVDYAERREDRLLLFPSLDGADSVYRYRARAVARGTFTLPPLTGEAMYAPRTRASTAAGTLVID